MQQAIETRIYYSYVELAITPRIEKTHNLLICDHYSSMANGAVALACLLLLGCLSLRNAASEERKRPLRSAKDPAGQLSNRWIGVVDLSSTSTLYLLTISQRRL